MSGNGATLFMSDLGANKKDDTYPPARPSWTSSMLNSWVAPRKLRILLGLLAAWLLYVFVKNIPTDVPPVNRRIDLYGPVRPQAGQRGQEIYGAESSQKEQSVPTTQSFDGPIKYLDLAASLRPSTSPLSGRSNVLFAASNPKSASRILPVACQMAQQNRTVVHMAGMGQQPITKEELMALHGVSASDCPIHWHDARPDHAIQSTSKRMERAVKVVIGHFHTALVLDAVFCDERSHEDEFFLPAIQSKADSLGISWIELPSQAHERVTWLATLDSTAMKHWKRAQIDIVIQAPLESSGSLLRLLKSIEHADYTGFAVPRIIIELPYDIDRATRSFVSRFQWPTGSVPDQSKLMLRHRIKSKHQTPLEASLRTLELFYPSSAMHHVLVLSPDVELSPNYYHYLMYNILEYKHSETSAFRTAHLHGISLEMPTTDLAGKDLALRFPESEPLLRWQMPGRHATLFFGDKWIEAQTFLSRRLLADPQYSKSSLASSEVSDRYPFWLLPMLEVMRCKNYYTLYPAFTTWSNDASLAVVHQELHQRPEEYIDDEPQTSVNDGVASELDWDRALTAGTEVDEGSTTTAGSKSLTSLMSLDLGSDQPGKLPVIEDVPMRFYDGDVATLMQSTSAASTYSEDFSLKVGGCTSLEARDQQNVESIDYLFCTMTEKSTTR